MLSADGKPSKKPKVPTNKIACFRFRPASMKILVAKFGVEKLRTNIINSEGNDLNVGKWFNFIVMVIIPIEFVAMLGWWFWQAVTSYDPEGWWKPLREYSLGTCLFQWILMIVIFILINNWLFNRTVGGSKV